MRLASHEMTAQALRPHLNSAPFLSTRAIGQYIVSGVQDHTWSSFDTEGTGMTPHEPKSSA